jgi:hypothetical protein
LKILFRDETMIKTTHLAYRVNSQTLTEYILIRETLWLDRYISFNFWFRIFFSRLLMNLTQLHVYIIDENNQTHIADFVRLCDVTPVWREKEIFFIN